jgi:5-(aminomethyl)-3-furanmethanol phosphate kinase
MMIPRRVIKVGGSLFDFPDLPARLRTWLEGQPPAVNFLVAGGGKLADAVRDADRMFRLDATVAHWLAIRCMSLQAEILHFLLPEANSACSVAGLSATASEPKLTIIDPWPILKHEEPTAGGECLPVGWHVTSDSIAARLAQMLMVDELVLLKSCLPAEPKTIESATASGYVDSYFPQAARALPVVRCVDLHSGEQIEWHPNSSTGR